MSCTLIIKIAKSIAILVSPISLALILFLLFPSMHSSWTSDPFGNIFRTMSKTSASFPTNAIAETNPEASFSTFHLTGAIGSLITDINKNNSGSTTTNPNHQLQLSSSQTNVYILVGNWTLNVADGNVKYFRADFIMALKNGTQMHVHSVANLRNIVIPSPAKIAGAAPPQTISTNVILSSANNYSLSFFASADILTNGKVQWKDVPITINVFNGNTISIFLYPSYTDNHFQGKPIYGAVTWLFDENNKPIKPPGFAYTQ